MGDKRLPDADVDVAILPTHSPSIHDMERFDPAHEEVHRITFRDAIEAGFTPCLRCWDVAPKEVTPREEREDREDHTDDTDGDEDE